eukprot:Awhi_evm1s14551
MNYGAVSEADCQGALRRRSSQQRRQRDSKKIHTLKTFDINRVDYHSVPLFNTQAVWLRGCFENVFTQRTKKYVLLTSLFFYFVGFYSLIWLNDFAGTASFPIQRYVAPGASLEYSPLVQPHFISCTDQWNHELMKREDDSYKEVEVIKCQPDCGFFLKRHIYNFTSIEVVVDNKTGKRLDLDHEDDSIISKSENVHKETWYQGHICSAAFQENLVSYWHSLSVMRSVDDKGSFFTLEKPHQTHLDMTIGYVILLPLFIFLCYLTLLLSSPVCSPQPQTTKDCSLTKIFISPSPSEVLDSEHSATSLTSNDSGSLASFLSMWSIFRSCTSRDGYFVETPYSKAFRKCLPPVKISYSSLNFLWFMVLCVSSYFYIFFISQQNFDLHQATSKRAANFLGFVAICCVLYHFSFKLSFYPIADVDETTQYIQELQFEKEMKEK